MGFEKISGEVREPDLWLLSSFRIARNLGLIPYLYLIG
jgi:hypothetical protein